MRIIKTYSELKQLKTFEERFEYLKTKNIVGHDTFGYDRYLNQGFYKSSEWKKVRDQVISRDMGCDLGCLDHEILYDRIIVHHMNPISKEDIINSSDILLNPEYLITVSNRTHEAIHYSEETPYPKLIERSKNDTCPWKNNQ